MDIHLARADDASAWVKLRREQITRLIERKSVQGGPRSTCRDVEGAAATNTRIVRTPSKSSFDML